METIKPFELKYCVRCLQNNLRPNIHFHEDGVCAPCKNHEKQKNEVDWNARWKQLEELCDKYRGSNGNGFDCAIAISGGKDSTSQVKLFIEDLGMNPLLISVGNLDWTNIGRKNFYNIQETFNREVLVHAPNPNLMRRLSKIAFEELGSPSWGWDSLGYSFPWRQAINQGIKLLCYGENVANINGGKDSEETPYAYKQSENDVVKPEWKRFIDKGITEKEMFSLKMVTGEEAKKHDLVPIYLSYYILWNSHLNFEVSTRWGFQTLEHEWIRSGALESYNQIDDCAYLINQWIKAIKYATGSASDYANRWIRYGLKTREEMVKPVEEKDCVLDQKIAEHYMDFIGMKPREFYAILDKWYNKNLFYQDRWGVWRKKFEVGVGMKPEWKK